MTTITLAQTLVKIAFTEIIKMRLPFASTAERKNIIFLVQSHSTQTIERICFNCTIIF